MLEKSWVAFIDFLDTKSLIAGLTPQRLNRLRQAVRDASAELRHDGTGEDPEAILWFTDNVAVVVPERPSEAISTLDSMVKGIARFQQRMLDHGLIARGAISWGDAYIDNQFATGQAIVDAYQYESKTVQFPRVALHPSVIDRMTGAHARAFRRLCTEQSDGIPFVDYLSALNTSTPESDNHQLLAAHRETLLAHMRRDDGTAGNKLGWLAAYHNHHVTVSEASATLLVPTPPPLAFSATFTTEKRQ